MSTNNVNKTVAEIENTFNKRIDVLEGKINKIANKKQPSSINEAACGKSSYIFRNNEETSRVANENDKAFY